MLTNVKQLIYSIQDNNVPFSQYYQQYIFDVQEQSIQYEVDQLKNADILSLERLIDKMYKEMLFNK